jgi:hypothetical protein
MNVVVLYPKVSYKEWAARYGISMLPGTCAKCNQLQYPTIPFAMKNWRGLQAPTHACGDRYPLFRAVRAPSKQL